MTEQHNEGHDAEAERLQKILARAGYGSRRKCEELIVEGRVEVNGKVENQLGSKANLRVDTVKVDGERVKPPRSVYYIINKPKGWYCTDDVPDKKILDLIPGEHPRIFTVGRLDKSCEGLMLATNDGRIANILTHPRYKVPKVYKAIVKGHIKFEDIAQIERALYYSMRGGAFERIKVLKRTPQSSGLRFIVYEGLPAAFRDICTRYGYPLSRVTRVKVGPLDVGNLVPGQSHPLTAEQITELIKYCEDAEAGRLPATAHRLVTAEMIKKASERTPKFPSKEKGSRGKPTTGQKRMRVEIGKSKGPTGGPGAKAPAKRRVTFAQNKDS